MMRSQFYLFQNHLDLAHHYWKKLLMVGDVVIDATCGNGHDTLFLAKHVLGEGQGEEQGRVYGFDIQERAIDETKKLLSKEGVRLDRVELERRSHETFPEIIEKESIKLIVYNLGYLPGSDKTKTTFLSTTLSSLKEALKLIKSGGVISVTCYPGHEEGKKEQEEILKFTQLLSPWEWSCTHHVWMNRDQSPTLFVLQRAISH